ncbi:sugar-binding transcriptional regulator [Pseudotabrizicola alkalilacus]|uniref:Sugar-binding transcriptional regulator n=1 Tax=Pseudotabrizicola alkalilacus TaxID=2305252 RepID=A0A411YWW4_9RHOB|nr:sugar-binding transcriptional regulator [Pseudotabrizicola alkalilacus]RGP35384.1 sugar-binding transcriptional regulator [Pseudotabrizicola alkalilacus]
MSNRAPYSQRLPSDESRDHLMVQVAKLYFDMDRTQAEIAHELGLTRWQVGKLLTSARAEGIVKIEITPRSSRKTSLEVALQNRFQLRDAVVVPMGDITDPSLLIDSVGQAAARYLAGMNPKPDLLGVSWGRTMAAVARALPQDWNIGAQVVLVNGNSALHVTSTRTSAVAEEFAQSAGGQATLLPVPAILGKSSTRDALEQDPIIARVLALAEAAPVVCFGMGGLSHQSVLTDSGYLTQDDIARLKALGAVGDILGRFVDAEGRVVDADLDNRTLGLRLDHLCEKEWAIGVVAGAEKHSIARAALLARYVSVLVTDETTAHNILEETP